ASRSARQGRRRRAERRPRPLDAGHRAGVDRDLRGDPREPHQRRTLPRGSDRTLSMLASLRRTLRELFGVVPTLDLHGLGVREALEETERFLRHAQSGEEPMVRIVYGKGHGSPGGRGVLRDVVPRWLEREGGELVERYQRVPDASGADGAVKVWVRRAAVA